MSRRRPGKTADRLERKLLRDLKLLAKFIRVYCDRRHRDAPRAAVRLKTHDLEAICGREVVLCEDCRKLLAHAFVKRTRCPFVPKPMCRQCPDHCYAPKYRRQIREVMKVAGRRLVLSGRLDHLFHLFSGKSI